MRQNKKREVWVKTITSPAEEAGTRNSSAGAGTQRKQMIGADVRVLISRDLTREDNRGSGGGG